jgi:hypothetical protein
MTSHHREIDAAYKKKYPTPAGLYRNVCRWNIKEGKNKDTLDLLNPSTTRVTQIGVYA